MPIKIHPLDILKGSGFPSVGVDGLDGRHQALRDELTASHGRKTGTLWRQIRYKQVLFNRTRTSCPRFASKGKKTTYSAVTWFPLLVCAGCLAGCGLINATISQQAKDFGFQREILQGKPFQHVAFFNGSPCADGQWHVYLDGDGKAWLTPHRAASDPTPKKSFLLDLMKSDPAPSMYLGRPCYHGLAHSPLCNPWVWTQQRYSQTVVESLVQALQRRLPDKQCRIVLIGYSGGGALAMLMAAKLPQAQGIVTLAGNLDVGAWTRLHGFSPLTGSLDPARQPALPEAIYQIHVTGTEDKQIPPDLIIQAIHKYPHAELIKVKNLNHQGNWSTIWPEVLQKIRSHLKKREVNQ